MRAALAAIASFLILTSTPAGAGFQYTTFRSAISPQLRAQHDLSQGRPDITFGLPIRVTSPGVPERRDRPQPLRPAPSAGGLHQQQSGTFQQEQSLAHEAIVLADPWGHSSVLRFITRACAD